MVLLAARFSSLTIRRIVSFARVYHRSESQNGLGSNLYRSRRPSL